jgi:hypothetical protein
MVGPTRLPPVLRPKDKFAYECHTLLSADAGQGVWPRRGPGVPGRLDDEETVARAATRYVPRNFSGGSQPYGRDSLGEPARCCVV